MLILGSCQQMRSQVENNKPSTLYRSSSRHHGHACSTEAKPSWECVSVFPRSAFYLQIKSPTLSLPETSSTRTLAYGIENLTKRFPAFPEMLHPSLFLTVDLNNFAGRVSLCTFVVPSVSRRRQQARKLEEKCVAAEAKRQFRLSRHETDALTVKMLLADAVNYLEAMHGSLRGGGVEANGAGSWLEIDDPEDERGRVGADFPWERS